MTEKKYAQTPPENEQAVAELAERLEKMDKAEGVFGEARLESVPDGDLEQAAAGAGELDLGFDLSFFQDHDAVYQAVHKDDLTDIVPILPSFQPGITSSLTKLTR